MSEENLQKVVPFRDSNLSKKEQIAQMFNKIAFRYDFMNHFLSLGIDRIWRRKAIRLLQKDAPRTILDVATGTGDFAILAHGILQPEHITGVDISEGMLELGVKKTEKLGLTGQISLQQADSEALPFPDETFDAVTVAFGVRNFEHLDQGLREMNRVLRKGGKTVILEFSQPGIFPVKQLFNLYFRFITPSLGEWLTRSKEAYSYLPDSVKVFPQGKEMVTILKKAGYSQAICIPLTFGICSIYFATK